ELARLFNAHFGLGADLEVVTMDGWSRDQYWDDTGLPWVMPSPNVPTDQTAIVYPGTVLFEGTMLSEGRGTTRPFELLGAPWIEAEPFADRMNAVGLAGVHFRPAVFEPTFQKHCKVACGGCQIHVTDRTAFKPVAGGGRPDPRPRPHRFKAGRGGRIAHSRVRRRPAGRVHLASTAVRIRARQDA